MDMFKAVEHVGPGGVKCPCCGREATNKTKRARLKALLRAALIEATEERLDASLDDDPDND